MGREAILSTRIRRLRFYPMWCISGLKPPIQGCASSKPRTPLGTWLFRLPSSPGMSISSPLTFINFASTTKPSFASGKIQPATFYNDAEYLNRVQECIPVIRARQNFEITTIRLQKNFEADVLHDRFVSFLLFLALKAVQP